MAEGRTQPEEHSCKLDAETAQESRGKKPTDDTTTLRRKNKANPGNSLKHDKQCGSTGLRRSILLVAFG